MQFCLKNLTESGNWWGSALFAVRQAVAAAKEQWGVNEWCAMSAPATVEKVALAANLPVSALSFT